MGSPGRHLRPDQREQEELVRPDETKLAIPSYYSLSNFLYIYMDPVCVCLHTRDPCWGVQRPGSWHGRMGSATSRRLAAVTTRAQLLLPPPPPPTRSVPPGRRPASSRACSRSSSSRCPTTSTTTAKGMQACLLRLHTPSSAAA